MEQRKMYFYAGTALCLALGIMLGALRAKKIFGSQPETMRIERGTLVREWPSELADVISLNKNDRLEILSEADYTSKNKNVPTILKVNNYLKHIDKATKQQYIIKEDTYYPIIAKKRHSYIIRATTNKGRSVELELEEKEVTPLEEGLWRHVKDKKGYMGWVRMK